MFLVNKKYYKFIYLVIDEVFMLIFKICLRFYLDFGIRKLVFLLVIVIYIINNKLLIKLWIIYVIF